jgi:putative peptide zinc metalloprotease protein
MGAGPASSVDTHLLKSGSGRLDGEPTESARDVYAGLERRLDPNNWRPRPAPGVETREFRLAGGGRYVMAANPDRSEHFRLDPEEAALLSRLDGTRTVGQIVVDVLDDTGELDPGEIIDLVKLFFEGGFLADRPVDVYAAVERALHPSTLRSRLRRLARELAWDWPRAEGFVYAAYTKVLRHVFNPVGVALAAIVTVGGVFAFKGATSAHHYRLTDRRFGVAFVILLLLDLAVIFIHEMGHATVLAHYKRRIAGAGFRIYFGAPSFFIRANDALMLPIRRRIFQAAAGPAFELVATSVASITLWLLPTGAPGRTLYQFIIINYFVLFLNLVPMLELDGYWILSDALGQPDLRPESLAFVRNELGRKILRRKRLSRREVGLAAFGLAGVAFTGFAVVWAFTFWRRVFGDTILAMWHGGWAAKLLLLVLVLLIGGPAIRAGVAAGIALTRRVRAVVDRIRFRLQSSWRIEAAQMLDESGLFGDVPVEILNDLAGRVRLRRVPVGAALIRQGDASDAFYMVRKGSVDVVEELPDGTTQLLRREGPGAGIGDQGVIERSPRSATVRATEPLEVFEVDRPTFERLLAARAAYAPTVQRITDLRRLPPFAALGSAGLSEISRHGEWVELAPGEVLFRQGDPGDRFYVVDHGRLDVEVDDLVVNQLGPGDHLGELALLADAPRSATIRARTPARLYAIGPDQFDQLLSSQYRRDGAHVALAVGAVRDH